jgi:hypothetical protein
MTESTNTSTFTAQSAKAARVVSLPSWKSTKAAEYTTEAGIELSSAIVHQKVLGRFT